MLNFNPAKSHYLTIQKLIVITGIIPANNAITGNLPNQPASSLKTQFLSIGTKIKSTGKPVEIFHKRLIKKSMWFNLKSPLFLIKKTYYKLLYYSADCIKVMSQIEKMYINGTAMVFPLKLQKMQQ